MLEEVIDFARRHEQPHLIEMAEQLFGSLGQVAPPAGPKPEAGAVCVTAHSANLFKRCSCGYAWDNREQFLKDPQITLVGYQASFNALQTGLLLFNHGCGTTLALKVEAFADLYHGPIYQERHKEEEDCPQYCLHADELRPCPVLCDCAFVRDIIQIIRRK